MTTTTTDDPITGLLTRLIDQTPLLADLDDALTIDDTTATHRGLSSGERTILATARHLRAISDNTPWVDATWQHLIAGALRDLARDITEEVA